MTGGLTRTQEEAVLLSVRIAGYPWKGKAATTLYKVGPGLRKSILFRQGAN